MSRFLNKRYQSLEAYTPGEQPRDMVYIKLNTNESPYPPAPSVVAAMDARQVENLRLYSDPTGLSLKQKLAELYPVATRHDPVQPHSSLPVSGRDRNRGALCVPAAHPLSHDLPGHPHHR